jgi:putative ABC transport system permease protein
MRAATIVQVLAGPAPLLRLGERAARFPLALPRERALEQLDPLPKVAHRLPPRRDAPVGQGVEPAIYLSTRQFPFRELTLAVRAVDRIAAVAAVRSALKDIAPGVPMAAVQTWGERFATLTAEPRLLMTLLVFFGILAALLAALGVYGLLSWSVALRRRELAIRLALGARPAALGRLVLHQSGVLVVLGLGIGLLLLRLSQGALSSVLFEVSPGDPGSLLLAGALLVAAAVGACVPPALRAARVDPAEGLRVE